MTETAGSLHKYLPKEIRDRIEPPDRARNEKVTARFTEKEFAILERFASERQETVTALVRKIALATIDDLGSGKK